MRTKLTYPPPIYAANHVVTIRTFAISLPVPGPVQTISVLPQNLSCTKETARIFSVRPFVMDSQTYASGTVPSPSLQQKTALNQPIQYRRPPTVGVNTALPQSAAHVGTEETVAFASAATKRHYIDASSKAFTKHSNADKSAFVKVKAAKPLLGVPGKIPERNNEVSSGPSVPPSSKLGLKSIKVEKTTSNGPEHSQTAPTPPFITPHAEKLKSTPSSLKRKRDKSNLESANATPVDSSQPLTNTLENGTKRRRQSTGTILVCPHCGERYDDGVEVFEHLKMCRLTETKEPSSSVSKPSNVVPPPAPRTSLRASETPMPTHNYVHSTFQPPRYSTQARMTYQPSASNAGGYYGYYPRP